MRLPKERVDLKTHRAPRRRAFTLIELLVVVAIIALLISILLPSLSKAREQARTTLCATRISQLARNMLIYGEDNKEFPPFVGIGWEDIHNADQPDKDLASTEGAPGNISMMSEWGWATAETWHSRRPEELWNANIPQDQWEQNGLGIRTGLVFKYNRFENLYRCPEFERQDAAYQNKFNYTRTVLARKWILSKYFVGGPEPGKWKGSAFGSPGHVLKSSQIHAPANLEMMLDEWWLRHVGSEYLEHSPPDDAVVEGEWCAVDCVFAPFGDEIGQYHGRPMPNRFFPNPDPLRRDPVLVKRGMVAYYDGHADLERQWWVDIKNVPEAKLFWNLQTAVLPYLSEKVYAARGRETRPF